MAPRAHRLAVGVLVVGALPFALITWWSVVTPITAVLVLAIGRGALGPRGVHQRRRASSRAPVGAGAVRR